MKFKAKIDDKEISGDVVNPGEWFGRAWVVQVYDRYFAIEGDTPQDIIDELADSEKFGHLINDPEGKDLGGNDSHPISLKYVRIYGMETGINEKVIPFEKQLGCSDLIYEVGDVSPLQYMG